MASKDSKPEALFLSVIMLLAAAAEEQPACGGNFMDLEECVDVLRALSSRRNPARNYCCSLIGNLVELEAIGSCLCTAIEATVLEVIRREIPSSSLSLLWDYCEAEIPPDFQCIHKIQLPSHTSI